MRRILKFLYLNKIRYLLCGGVAVNLYGVKRDVENLQKLQKLKALMKIDIPLEKIKEYMKLSPKKLEFLEEINLLNYSVFSKILEIASSNSSKDETS